MSTLTLSKYRELQDLSELSVTERGASRSFLIFATLLTLITFVTPFEESWTRSLTYDQFFSADHVEAGMEHGSVDRQITLGAMGLLGAAALVMLRGRNCTRKPAGRIGHFVFGLVRVELLVVG